MPSSPGGALEEAADVGLGPEPQLAAMGEASGHRLGGEQAGATETGGEDCCLVEQGAGVEDLEHFGMGPTDGADDVGWGTREQLGQLAPSAAVEGLEEPPVPAGGERQVVVGQPGRPLSAQDADG
jgi:hypothetical protein